MSEETDKDVLSLYKLKKCGKDVDGVYIIDGYTYKGKRAFLKAVDGFKKVMKKGFIGEFNIIQIKVLDTRTHGAELAIEIECEVNNSRGIAVLKLYGPSTKKQNVVMVTKSKESDHKYVVMLAERVIEPLMHKFLKDEENAITVKQPFVKRAVSVKGKKVIKCPLCDKTSYSAPGLKVHITRMHNTSRMTLDTIMGKLNICFLLI